MRPTRMRTVRNRLSEQKDARVDNPAISLVVIHDAGIVV